MSVVEEMFLTQGFLFFRIHPKSIPIKLQSWTNKLLDRHEIWTSPSEPIFSYSQRWDL